jgi:hypothetical protein
MALPLPTIDCTGCGACCRHVATPPGFYPLYAMPHRDCKEFTNVADWEYWRASPRGRRSKSTI